MNTLVRKEQITSRFVELYGGQPTLWSQAPGRVDLMGSHTDYNEGFVLTLAINRDTWIAARPRSDRQVSVFSLNVEGGGLYDLDAISHDTLSPWTNYVRGVAAVMQQEGYATHGFDGLIHSSIPFGSGLSSSAALEVATAVLFDALGDLQIDPIRIAIMCQRAENTFVGMNCGILDQYSSVMGRAGSVLLLDCRDISSQTRPIAGGIQVVICDTRAERALTGSEYAERRAQCEEGARILTGFYPQVAGFYLQVQTLRDVSLEQWRAHKADLSEVVARRCRFIIEENRRVLDVAEALAQGDHARLGSLATASFAGARDLYEIVSPEMEHMMAAMQSAPGVIGARQTGAGFGGCMVAFVRQGGVEGFAQGVQAEYAARTGISAHVYAVRAAPGAGVLVF